MEIPPTDRFSRTHKFYLLEFVFTEFFMDFNISPVPFHRHVFLYLVEQILSSRFHVHGNFSLDFAIGRNPFRGHVVQN